ncbi:MAG: SUMF1/EgtB/PvdO family nonheme iron enzyme [Planctomycetes bacterium]|nr:SUMF1/EgtB/PvdO family nonheme iron enzyme [Planctomycetota bacterium]
MKTVLLVAALLVLQDDKAKTALEQLFEQKTTELAAAEAQLEEAYALLERLFAQASAEPTVLAGKIAAAIQAEAPALRDKLTGAGAARAPAKAAQLVIAQDGLAAALAASNLDPVLQEPLAQLLSTPLLPSLLDAESADLEPRVTHFVEELFLSGQEFARVWNDSLFPHVAAARQYARARASYIEVGQRLERERSPERYAAGGERLPPGRVEVKAGSYEIGPYSGWVQGRKGIGKKSKRVNLRAFFIDRTEVTNAEYMVFWKWLGEEARPAHLPRYWTRSEEGDVSFAEGRGDHPVVGVSCNDALAYAAWCGKRLPSEDEWEAAARGAEGRTYPWGSEYEAGRANDRDAAIGDTAPVGSFPAGASPCGCLDMAGNVEEWTASTEDGTALAERIDSNLLLVVIRGGNFNSGASNVSATFRWVYPGLSTENQWTGFRCALSADN